MKWFLFIAAWVFVIWGLVTNEDHLVMVGATYMAAYAVCDHIDTRLGK